MKKRYAMLTEGIIGESSLNQKIKEKIPPTKFELRFKKRILIIIFFFYKFIILFFYFWLCWVFVAVCGLSLVAASGGYSSLRCAGFSLRWLLLLWSTGSRRMGFSSCGTWAQQLWLTGSRAQAQQLWRTSPAAPRHVGSSRTRARTRVPCIGRRIPNHCATREAQRILIIVVRNKGRIQSEGNITAKVLRQKTEQHIERFKSTE